MPIVNFLLAFPRWYVTKLPVMLLRFFLNTNLVLEDTLAIRLHARLLFTPLFHDTTIFGRLFSMVFRMIRVIGGLLALITIDILLAPLLASFLLIFALPFISKYFLLAFPLIIIFYFSAVYNRPSRRLTATTQIKDIEQIATAKARTLLTSISSKPQKAFAKYLSTPDGQYFCHKLGLNTEAISRVVASSNLAPANYNELFAAALRIAVEARARHLETYHVAAAYLSGEPVNTLLKPYGVAEQLVLSTARWLTYEQPTSIKLWDEDYYQTHLGGVNRGWTGVVTPVLDSVSTDLTRAAMRYQLPTVFGREAEFKQIIQILTRAGNENVMITGEPGCGKTSLVYKVAQAIVAGDAPKSLFSKRIVKLDSGALIAGISGQGGMEARMQKLLAEIEYSENIILFLDDVHNLFSISTAAGNLNLLELLKPHLSSNRFQVIAATSTENFEKFIEPRQEFAQLFQQVEMAEVTKEEAISVLEVEATQLEKKHGVTISIPAVYASVELADRYIHNRVLPGKALDLLDEACVVAANLGANSTVVPRHVETIVEQKTHTPVGNAQKREKDVLLHLEEKLHARMIGQETAVSAVANALRRVRAGVYNEKRPIASFLFVGPTGVGKTELAKTLSEVYFGKEDAMIRFDMSEFQSDQAIYRLIGTPPASATDLSQPGALTEAARQKPFALLLFDEIEKANPRVLDLFLQMLDEGIVTDSLGHKVTFKDTIIIATSNAGTMEIEQGLQAGQTVETMQQQLLNILSTYFRIEFLNRFDDIILFRPLTIENMIAITRLQLTQLAKHLQEKDFFIEFSPELVSSLAQRGYNPMLGARPLRRLIQDEVESQIAKLILSEQLPKGKQVLLSTQNFQSPQL